MSLGKTFLGWKITFTSQRDRGRICNHKLFLINAPRWGRSGTYQDLAEHTADSFRGRELSHLRGISHLPRTQPWAAGNHSRVYSSLLLACGVDGIRLCWRYNLMNKAEAWSGEAQRSLATGLPWQSSGYRLFFHCWGLIQCLVRELRSASCAVWLKKHTQGSPLVVQ